MADTTLPVQAGILPSGFCPTDLQSMANGFAAIYSVILSAGTGLNVVASSTKPADTSSVWLQLDSLGRPVRVYYFANGAWLSMHPLVPGHIMIWDQALPNFATFDGGDANPISPVSGPMWEEVTELRARFPIGAGTLPSTLVLAVTETGGEEKHTLVSAETPAHTHFEFADKISTVENQVIATEQTARRRNSGSGDDYQMVRAVEEATLGLTSSFGGDGAGATTAHQNLPPYYTVYYLRRTQKLFYVVP